MSTDYRCVVNAKLDQIFDGRLSKYGLVEKVVAGETSETQRCLTDGGSNELWISKWGDDQSNYICGRRSSGVVEANLHRDFDGVVYVEGQPEFWGFDTEYEFDLWQTEPDEQQREPFYSELINFLTFKPHKLEGNLDIKRMLIAHELVIEDPNLLDLSRKFDLLRLIDDVAIKREKTKKAEEAAAAKARRELCPSDENFFDEDLPF